MRTCQVLFSALCASVIALTAATPTGAQEAPKRSGPRLLGTMPQEFLLTKVIVSDIVKSFEFYTKVIGLKLAVASDRPATPPTSSTVGEVGLNFSGTQAEAFFLIVKSTTETPTPGAANMTTIGFKVSDAPAVIRRGKAAGYEVIREAPMVTQGEMSVGFLRDPDGYRVEILQASSYPVKGR